MNEISILINFLVNHFANNELVNTVTLNEPYELDTNKTNIYMLVNINLKETEVTPDTVIGYFDIEALQQRDISNKVEDSKLMENSNFIDNLNETHSVLQRFINVLENQNNSFNIELESKTRLSAVKNRPSNGLDGFKFQCSISIPNKGKSC